MVFPREEHAKMGTNKYTKPTTFPEISDLMKTIEEAKKDAIGTAIFLEMKCDFDKAVCEVKIPGSYESLEDDIEDLDEDGNQDKEVYISDGESEYIEKDLSLLLSVDNLELKNYEEKAKKFNIKNKKNSPYIQVLLKNRKLVTVRKTSLCWLLSEKHGKLSSDRILRVRGENAKKDTEKKNRKFF